MAITGLLLLLSFALLIPRGSAPGSLAVRNIDIFASHIDRTPGYQAEPEGRTRRVRIALGLGLLVVSVLLLVLGL